MRSRLYECQVMHRRFSPKAHRFAYRIFLFALDLDELDLLDRQLRLFSVGRPNLYSFRDTDYLPVHEPPHHPTAAPPPPANSPPQNLKARIRDCLATHGINLAGGCIELITMPRVAGYLFNPVSFYFCYDHTGVCVAALPEITNTFREMKPFFLGPETRILPPASSDQNLVSFQKRVPKHFYVSPFSDVDVSFDFQLRPPAERLAIQIDDYVGPTRTLTSTLTGRARPLTDGALASLTFRHPLQPLHTISLIHWHALRLWLKRVPWFAKAARSADQRDLYRPDHAGPIPEAIPIATTPLPHRPDTV